MAYIVNIYRSIVCHMLPIEVTSCRAGLPRSPKDFQELLLGSAVYVGVGREPEGGGSGSWVIAREPAI